MYIIYHNFFQETTTMFRSIRQVRYLQRPFRHFSDVRVPMTTQEKEEKRLEKENMILDAVNEDDYLRQVSFKHAQVN